MRKTMISLLFVLLALWTGVMRAAAVALDPTFGVDGIVATNWGEIDGRASDLLVLPDGNILLNNHGGLFRFTNNGGLDPTFGDQGFVRDGGEKLALQADGKIISAGTASNGFDLDFVLQRYHSNGAVDLSFGQQGSLMLDLAGGSDWLTAVALQSDGKIVAAGYTITTTAAVPSHFVLARFTPEGRLDDSFDGDGVVTTRFGADQAQAAALLIQPDGKIVAVGYTESQTHEREVAIARYQADGSLDGSFAENGLGRSTLSAFIKITDALLQPDGKFILVGMSRLDGGFTRFTLLRYSGNGVVDGTFGNGGAVTTAFGDGDEIPSAITLQPDGKLLAAGYAFMNQEPTLALARYQSNGALDSTFGEGGKQITLLDDTPNGQRIWEARIKQLVVQPDGNLVAAGELIRSNQGQLHHEGALLRYTANGALDPAFGDGGMVLGLMNGESTAAVLAVQPDGKIVAGGTVASYLYDGFQPGLWGDFAFIRYQPDGALDPTFGEGGKVRINYSPLDDRVTALAVQPDGKIVAIGNSQADLNGSNAAILLRLNADGSPDDGFRNGAQVIDELRSVTDLVLQPDGNIVVAGYAADGYDFNFALVRYQPDGVLDPTFGVGGTVITSFGPGPDLIKSLTLQPDGKLLVTGTAHNGQDGDLALARYQPDGALDATFDQDGKLRLNFAKEWESSRDDGGEDILVQPDGKIVVVGYTRNNLHSKFVVVRCLPDGALDPSFSGDGKVVRGFQGYIDGGYAVAWQSDGKLLVSAGEGTVVTTFPRLLRFTPDGRLDATFGAAGKWGAHLPGVALALQQDGKLLVAGGRPFTLTRLQLTDEAPPIGHNLLFLPLLLRK